VRRAALALALGALAAAPAAAQMPMPGGPGGEGPPGPHVDIGFDAYAPDRVDAVVGDAVTWTNASVRAHTVTADDGSFDSGRLTSDDRFAHTFTAEGSYAYHCTVHPFMRGEVDVHELLLDPQPAAAAPNRPFPLRGRAASGLSDVTIVGDDGSRTPATVAPDGSFTATVAPASTTTYRAVSGEASSPPVQLVVLDRTVAVQRSHSSRTWTLRATVAPAAPGQIVVLQLRLRDRFGWWPVATGRLDGASQAVLRTRLRHRTLARVLLTLPDMATPLAFSPTVTLGP
jgi:plastocyanin